MKLCKSDEAERRICWRRHSAVELSMKTIGIFGVVMTASIALLQPAQGRTQGSTHSSAHHFSASAGHYSSHPRNFSGNTARYYRASPRYSSARYSSQAAFRHRTVSNTRYVNRTSALNPRAYSGSGPRSAVSRRAALRSQGFDSQGRVLAQSSRNWARNRDHFWHGHRTHWRNNAWVIIDPWFYPWGYGYYPYGAYSYSDDGYYDDGSAPNDYSQSEYDNGSADSSVSQVQAALARKGYYHGAIDGSMGPATRDALRRYQRYQGLDATGQIDQRVLESLRLG
jgi:Putative peptidoglycan binding domain